LIPLKKRKEREGGQVQGKERKEGGMLTRDPSGFSVRSELPFPPVKNEKASSTVPERGNQKESSSSLPSRVKKMREAGRYL